MREPAERWTWRDCGRKGSTTPASRFAPQTLLPPTLFVRLRQAKGSPLAANPFVSSIIGAIPHIPKDNATGSIFNEDDLHMEAHPTT